MLPLMGLLIVITMHWQQFLALFSLGHEAAELSVRLKKPPLPWLYVAITLACVLLFEVLPYLEEFARAVRKPPRP